MDINYKLLQERISKMENTHILVKEEISNYNISQLKQLPKKDTQIISYIEETFIEKEYLKEEISNYKNEIKRLKKENEELRKENNAKKTYKNYILEIDKLMDKLPPTRDYSKRVELISRFIDWSLAIFDRYEKIGLNKTARYGYKERIILIRAVLSKYYSNVLGNITNLVEVIRNSKDKGENLLTLDSFITETLYKDANLKEKELDL